MINRWTPRYVATKTTKDLGTHKPVTRPQSMKTLGKALKNTRTNKDPSLRQCEMNDADLGAVEERQIYVLENDFIVVREDLAYPVHRENDLFVSHGGSLFANYCLLFAKILKKTI